MSIKKDDLRRKYGEILSRLESDFQYRDVPSDVMTYYRLVILIYRGSFGAYFNSFGWLDLCERDADQGKRALFGKALTQFECDVIMILNQKCREMESRASQKLLPAKTEARATI